MVAFRYYGSNGVPEWKELCPDLQSVEKRVAHKVKAIQPDGYQFAVVFVEAGKTAQQNEYLQSLKAQTKTAYEPEHLYSILSVLATMVADFPAVEEYSTQLEQISRFSERKYLFTAVLRTRAQMRMLMGDLDGADSIDRHLSMIGFWQKFSPVLWENRKLQKQLMRGTLDFAKDSDAVQMIINHSRWFTENLNIHWRLSTTNFYTFCWHADQLLKLVEFDCEQFYPLMEEFLALMKRLSLLWAMFDAPLLYYRGRLLLLDHDVKGARASFEAALDELCDCPWLEGRILLELNRDEEALELFRKSQIGMIWVQMRSNYVALSNPDEFSKRNALLGLGLAVLFLIKETIL